MHAVSLNTWGQRAGNEKLLVKYRCLAVWSYSRLFICVSLRLLKAALVDESIVDRVLLT